MKENKGEKTEKGRFLNMVVKERLRLRQAK